jgi:hypothetical protein
MLVLVEEVFKQVELKLQQLLLEELELLVVLDL